MRISMVSGYRCRVATEVKSTIEQVRSEIRSELADYLRGQRNYLTSIASELVPVCDALDEFLLDGGKRLRPLFAYAGLIASGATPTREIIRAISSLELLQACALIHDDLMDRSDTRRGKPAIHRLFENLHQSSAMNGLATQFGEAAAVLLGDLALVWSDQMLNTSGISTQSLLAAHIIHDANTLTYEKPVKKPIALNVRCALLDTNLASTPLNVPSTSVPLSVSQRNQTTPHSWMHSPAMAFRSVKHFNCVMTCSASSAIQK
jgi:hypothetical protein